MILSIKHHKKHKIKENIKNTLSLLKAYYRYIFRISGIVNPPKEYKLLFEDNFKSIDKKWRLAQPWGDFHPAYLNQYYDTTGELAYVSEEGLILEIKNKPKKYYRKDLPGWRQGNLPEEFTIPISIGLVSSIEGWQYGWFESWIRIPKGKNYWLAYWLSGINNWPPEIDIFEGYSKNGQYYNSGFLKLKNFKIQPNLHYGSLKENTKEDYGAYNVPVHRATERFVQYVCHWEKDFIRIYYDGCLIFQTTDQEILKWYNGEKEECKMGIILSHGLLGNHQTVQESKMVVRSMKIFQK
jgi:hypothetical protein